MTEREKKLGRLFEAFCRLPEQGEGSDGALDALVDLGKADAAVLADAESIRTTGLPHGLLSVVSHTCDASELKEAIREHGLPLPAARLIQVRGHSCEFACLFDLIPPSEYRETPFYLDCGRHYGVNNSIAIGVCRPGEPHLKFVISLLYRNRRAVDRSLKKWMAQLAPHVKAGLLCLGAWLESSLKTRALEVMADFGGEALVAVHRGRLLAATSKARRILGLDGASTGRRVCWAELLRMAPRVVGPSCVQRDVEGANGGRYRLHAVRTPELDGNGALLVRFVPLHVPADVFCEEMKRAALARGLTWREADIYALLSQGLSNPEIGRALGLSVHTVRTYLRRMFKKLDVSSRTEAVHVVCLAGAH